MGLDLFDETIALTQALRARGVEYALIDAVALARRPQDLTDVRRLQDDDR